MREQSHLDDMRSALRGDFERLAARRGEPELVSPPVDEDSELEANEPDDVPPPSSSWFKRLLSP